MDSAIGALFRFPVGNGLTAAQVQALPTDPKALRAWLLDNDDQSLPSDGDGNSKIFLSAADVLTTPTTSATRTDHRQGPAGPPDHLPT